MPFLSSARRGNSALEVIVMLATVLFIMIIGVSALGWSMRDSFGRFAFFPHSTSVTITRSGADSRPTPGYRSLAEAFYAEQTRQVWQWEGIGICVALNLVLWILLFRRFRQRSPSRLPLTDEAPRPVEHARTFEQRQQLVRFLTADASALFEGRLEIRQVMTTSFVSVFPDSRPDTAAEAIRNGDAHHAVVWDTEHKLLGVVCLSDIHELTTGRVEQVMHREVPNIPSNASLIQALTVFLRCDLGCLPVLRDETVVGLLTSTDVIVALQSILQFLDKISDRVKPALREHRGVSITEMALSQDAVPPAVESMI